MNNEKEFMNPFIFGNPIKEPERIYRARGGNGTDRQPPADQRSGAR